MSRIRVSRVDRKSGKAERRADSRGGNGWNKKGNGRGMISGGDEARVARARGSGRGALPSLILANGTPLSRVPPPRAGWAVQINEANLPTPSHQSTYRQQRQQQQQQQQSHQQQPPLASRVVEQWASERAASSSDRRSASSSSPEAATRIQGTGSSSRTLLSPQSRARRAGFEGREERERGAEVPAGFHFANHWQEEEELEAKKKEEHHRKRRVDAAALSQAEHLELRGRPMSQNNAISPLSRPPSSQANASSLDAAAAEPATVTDDADAHSVHSQQSVGGRVHDHNRPFPPPRLPGVHVVATPSNPRGLVTAAPPIASTATTTTTTITTTTTTTSSTFRSRPRNVDATTAATTTDSPAGGGRGGAGAGVAQVSNDTPPRSPIGEVSLTVPRPDGERAINEYVEAPFKQGNQERRFDDDGKRAADCPKIDRRHRQKGVADASVAATHRLHATRTPAFRGLNASSGTNAAASTGSIATTITTTGSTNAVTKQPVSFTKEPANSLSSRSYDPAGLSIMCNFCGRCRCESCREPPPLPSKWLCDNKCFCSADTILDYASCLCCVKGLFYHCVDGSTASGIDGEAGGSCADEPCSCTGNKRASRWACLGALTLVMPCLLCYWPFKGCVQLCEMCYARHAAQGCRCNPGTIGNTGGRHHPIVNDIGDSRDPEKRLLDPVTPEL